MSDPHEDDIPENTTRGAHMRALRRESRASLEQTARVVELLGRVNTRLDQINARLDQMQGDLILSENISRHGEILNILERLDRANIKPLPREVVGQFESGSYA